MNEAWEVEFEPAATDAATLYLDDRAGLGKLLDTLDRPRVGPYAVSAFELDNRDRRRIRVGDYRAIILVRPGSLTIHVVNIVRMEPRTPG